MSVDGIMTRLNPLLGWILRSRLHWLASSGLLLLTVTGRRTGRRYSIPVGYQRSDDTVAILVSEARRKNWWRNYLEGGPAEVWLRGVRHAGHGRVCPPGSPEFRAHFENALRRVPMLDRVFQIEFDSTRGLSNEQLDHLATEGAVVEVRLVG